MQDNSLQPQIRSKELSDREIKNLKTTLQRLQLPGLYEVYYCIGTKESNTGLFSNDRLVILNNRERSIGYISKLPPGLIPFLNQQEIRTLKFKSKVSRQEIINNQIKEFRCYPLPGKVTTFQVFFKRGNKNQVQKWDFQMANFNLMYEWVNLINNTLLFDEEKPKPPQKLPQPLPPPSPSQPITESKKVLNENPFESAPVNSSQPPPPPPLTTANSKIHISNISYDQPQINSSRIAKLPYNDHVSQLKYLRKQNPALFNMTNELSKKNLPPYQENLPQNNKNTVNATDELNLNFSKKPTKDDFINEKQYQDTAYYRQKDLSRQTLQNSQAIIQPYKKTRSGVNPIQKNTLPIPSSLNQYKRYNSEYQNPVNGDSPVFPLSSPKDPGVSQRISRLRQSEINKANSRMIINKNYDGMQNSNAQKNITIESRNKQFGSITVNEPLKSNSRLNESNLSKSNLIKKDYNIMSSKSINNNSFRGLHRKRWNQIFAEANDKLQIYQQFIHKSYNIVREIINQMALDQNQKDYIPIQIKPPYFTFYTEGIIIILHYFQNSKNINTNTYNDNTPVLYDQSSYEQLKRQFYHYNTILSVTSNQGFIKVPLSSYFQYKGVVAFCKAEIPQNFSQVTPKRYEKQFDIIQNQIHLRFMFGSFNTYLHPNSKYIILDNMKELIPQIPLQKNEGHYFRKQFLLSYQHIIQDIQDTNQANDFITHRVVPQTLGKLQSLQTYIVNSTDLFRYLHDEGLSFAYLPLLIQQTKSSFLKRIFLSQLVSIIFTSIFRSQINNIYKQFPVNDFQQVNIEVINKVIIDCTHSLLEMMFSYSNNAQRLWKVIVQQCKIKYRVVISKQDLISGYLLSSIAQRIGIILDFRKSTFDKHQVQFFTKTGNIPRDLIVGFKLKIRRYDLSSISGKIQTIQNILYSDPTNQNFNALVNTLKLKEQPIPDYLQHLEQTILTYLCNFVPYSQHEEFQNIGIYNMVLLQPHSLNSTKCSLLAIKWCIKKKYVDQALKIYEMKQIENAFWLGQYNPAISQFYDFFSMYYASVGRYDQSIQLAKLSLKNIMKVVGVAELPVADKHYQLGNIYFKMGRKEDSLRQYTLTKDILLSHQQTNIAQYAIILLKLSVLYLNFGKINEAVNHSLQALKIFENTQGSEQDQIGTFEVLSRCYQITKKQNQLENVGQLSAQKFNQTEDYLIFQRMAKLVLYIKIKNLSSAQAKAFLAIISKLQEQSQDINELEAFSFLHKKCLSENLMRKVEHYLQNIVYLYEEASKKDLFRRYKSLDQNTKYQAEEMLVILEALGIFIGFGYLIGSLRQNYD